MITDFVRGNKAYLKCVECGAEHLILIYDGIIEETPVHIYYKNDIRQIGVSRPIKSIGEVMIEWVQMILQEREMQNGEKV